MTTTLSPLYTYNLEDTSKNKAYLVERTTTTSDDGEDSATQISSIKIFEDTNKNNMKDDGDKQVSIHSFLRNYGFTPPESLVQGEVELYLNMIEGIELLKLRVLQESQEGSWNGADTQTCSDMTLGVASIFRTGHLLTMDDASIQGFLTFLQPCLKVESSDTCPSFKDNFFSDQSDACITGGGMR